MFKATQQLCNTMKWLINLCAIHGQYLISFAETRFGSEAISVDVIDLEKKVPQVVRNPLCVE